MNVDARRKQHYSQQQKNVNLSHYAKSDQDPVAGKD